MIKYLILLIFPIAIFCCKSSEETLIPGNGNGNFSIDQDSLLFDTILAGQVSTTKRFTIYNNESGAVKIPSIRLGGMALSPYKLIINGIETNSVNDFFLRAKDSILVLVTVKLDNSANTNPFLVLDSVLVSNGKKDEKIYLTAYGRNASYYNGDTVKTNTIWDSSSVKFIRKTIVIAPQTKLTILPGTDLYFAKDQGMRIEGTLQVLGDTAKQDHITFNGPRTDKFWEDKPGQWDGLIFANTSSQNIIRWTEINNAKNAIVLGNVENTNSPTDLSITYTTIRNSSESAIQSFSGLLTMWNSLIYNFSMYGLAIFNGGTQTHYNNTIVSYENTFRRSSSGVYISDGNLKDQKQQTLSLDFTNNIVWGSEKNEIELKKITEANWIAPKFSNNILLSESKEFAADSNLVYAFINTNLTANDIKLFKIKNSTNFELDPKSVAINKGKNVSLYSLDLNAKLRTDKFDIGAFEYKE